MAVGDQFPLVKRGQTPMQWGMQYAVGMQYVVGVSAKEVNSHSGLSTYGYCTPTAYCVTTTYCVLHTPLHGFDLFTLKVMVPTTHIY